MIKIATVIVYISHQQVCSHVNSLLSPLLTKLPAKMREYFSRFKEWWELPTKSMGAARVVEVLKKNKRLAVAEAGARAIKEIAFIGKFLQCYNYNYLI